jgi:hypothetical protein
MKRSVARKFRFGRKLFAGLLLAMVATSMPVTGNAEVHHGGGHGSDFSYRGGHHGSSRSHHGAHHGFSCGHQGGHHGFSLGYVNVPYDPGIVYRGPLGFELHSRLRHGRALHRGDYAATPDYYAECRNVYSETYVNGRPATVSGLMCYDEYGSPYVIPESRRLVEYYE